MGAGLIITGSITLCRAITGLGLIAWLRVHARDHTSAERRRLVA